MRAYSLGDGRRLVTAARRAIEAYLGDMHADRRALEPDGFQDRYGLFVTLETHPERELRGCIGYLYGAMAVGRAVVEAAIAAASEDPRFGPLTRDELDDITVEVSALAKPETLGSTEAERLGNLVIGRHGLIIERGYGRGLLLPNVATEQRFDRLEFLEAVCEKAGLENGAWRGRDARLYSFETQIFREEEPGGTVVELGQQAGGDE